jgi:hypothetical protein
MFDLRRHRREAHDLGGRPPQEGRAIGALRNLDAERVTRILHLIVVLQAAAESVDAIPYGSVLQSGVVSWAPKRYDGHRVLT